jgi:DNA-binding protein HU-beta
MTKNELVRELAEDFEIPRKQVGELVEAMLDKITEILKAGDKVQLTPFGQFKIRDRAARVARNPQTGEPVNVPAKRVLKFTAGRTLKEAVGTAKRGAGVKKSAAKKAPARKAAAPAARKAAAPARKAAAPGRKAAGAPARKAAAPARKTAAKKSAPARKAPARKR